MTGGLRVLLAPDKFKGSLPASGVAAAVGRGLVSQRRDVEPVVLPVADGGDGTLDAAISAGFERVPVTVAGPTGEPVATAYARRGPVAVVEMADACGLVRLPGGVPAPLTASSRGVGEAVLAALDAGCDEVVLGIGGSASTDGGAGLLEALGARLLDASGAALGAGGGSPGVPGRAGPRGAFTRPWRRPGSSWRATWTTRCWAPRGRQPSTERRRAPAPRTWPCSTPPWPTGPTSWPTASGPTCGPRRAPGAAGGVGFAALAVLGADMRPGIELMLDLVGFDEQLPGSALVVTGEGSLDEQSLRGKAPVGVARRAAAAGVPVVAVCGRRQLGTDALQAAGIRAAYALLDHEPDPEVCMREPAPLLERLGATIARDHLP